MGREILRDMVTDRRMILISQSTRYEAVEWLQLAEIISSGWFFEYYNRPPRSVQDGIFLD